MVTPRSLSTRATPPLGEHRDLAEADVATQERIDRLVDRLLEREAQGHRAAARLAGRGRRSRRARRRSGCAARDRGAAARRTSTSTPIRSPARAGAASATARPRLWLIEPTAPASRGAPRSSARIGASAARPARCQRGAQREPAGGEVAAPHLGERVGVAALLGEERGDRGLERQRRRAGPRQVAVDRDRRRPRRAPARSHAPRSWLRACASRRRSRGTRSRRCRRRRCGSGRRRRARATAAAIAIR